MFRTRYNLRSCEEDRLLHESSILEFARQNCRACPQEEDKSKEITDNIVAIHIIDNKLTLLETSKALVERL